MKRFKKVGIVSAVLVMALSLAACGGGKLVNLAHLMKKH